MAASTAMLGTAAVPAAALDLPSHAAPATHAGSAAWSDASVSAERSRWRHRGHHRDDGISAGDVIAGAAIIGGIFAIASALDNDRDEPRVDYRNPRPTSYSGDGIDRAMDMCVAEIERDVRVASVDVATRDAAGWRVAGTVADGGGFTCLIGNDGRISDIDYGQGYERGGVTYSTQARGNQWDDDTYAAAWRQVGTGSPGVSYSQPAPVQPAYPGGPLPGEDYYED